MVREIKAIIESLLRLIRTMKMIGKLGVINEIGVARVNCNQSVDRGNW